MSGPIAGVGASTPTPSPDLRVEDAELLGVLAAFPGSELVDGPTGAGFGTCCHGERHAAHHHRHPVTGRAVCWVCHPPDGRGVPGART